MKLIWIAAGLLIIAILAGPIIAFLGDFFWFDSLGYKQILLKIISWRLVLGLGGFAIFFAISFINARLAFRRLGKKLPAAFAIAIVASAIAGFSLSTQWPTVLKFLNSSEFPTSDPVFAKNVAFYVFSLPFIRLICGFLTAALIFSLIFSIGIYAYSAVSEGELPPEGPQLRDILPAVAHTHLIVLLAFLLFCCSGFAWLHRFDFLFGLGTVVGAGFTDLHINIPFWTFLPVAIAAGALIIVLKRNVEFLAYVAGGLILILIIWAIIAAGVQALVVKPDEFAKEKPYLCKNIKFTLKAYGIGKVNEKKFIEGNLTIKKLQKAKPTLDSVRLWDWRPLKRTYEQQQSLRTYYRFPHVDVDRYRLDGKLRLLMLSARELSIENLPERSKTWVNRHLVYTHGYGYVASGVAEQTEEGFPKFAVKNIPPSAQWSELTLKRPQIYYGELTKDWVVTKTNQKEFDYPKGEENVYKSYEGGGGIKMDSAKRVLYSILLGSPQLLFSDVINEQSRLLLHRKIQERVKRLAPFLKLDRDPYLVISKGKLYWIQDSYLVMDKYPYSEPIGPINYIRNSVKIVIDAYSGDVSFYVVEEEPLIKTWRKIFPSLFRHFKQMPKELKRHLRYPEGLFRIQAKIYEEYHMRDPRVFYGREDAWRTPNEKFRGIAIKMQPYYVIAQLNEKLELILMRPFVPKGKSNMIGWMAASGSQAHYGELNVFLFPKNELKFGPMQIENRIIQDTRISKRMGEWEKGGAQVLRGNLLVIPIKDVFLYVEPVFLKAAERESLPQLKRVIVAHKDKLTWKPTFEEALTDLFGLPKPKIKKIEFIKKKLPKKIRDLLAEAIKEYEEAQLSLKKGNLTAYAKHIEKLGIILNQTKAVG